MLLYARISSLQPNGNVRCLLPESRMIKGMQFFLQRRLKALESEPTALLCYRKRAIELEVI